jgi:hypothetical protein
LIAMREISRLWSAIAFITGSKAVTLSTQPVSVPGGSTRSMPRMKPIKRERGKTRTRLSGMWLIRIIINYKISVK